MLYVKVTIAMNWEVGEWALKLFSLPNVFIGTLHHECNGGGGGAQWHRRQN